MNSVHPYHKKAHFEPYRHFVFAFHDSTFECVARGFSFEVSRGSVHSALSQALEQMRESTEDLD